MNTFFLIIGVIAMATSLIAAYMMRASILSRRVRQGYRELAGTIYALGLFIFFDALLYVLAGKSFTTLLLEGSMVPVVIYVAGAILGMAYEYIWQFGLRWWHYPSVEKRRILLAFLPLYWGVFMLVMHDTYAVLRVLGYGTYVAAIATAVIQGLLIEGINLWTRSWVYTGVGSSIYVLVFGWIVGLGFVFVFWFNQFLLNPFGF